MRDRVIGFAGQLLLAVAPPVSLELAVRSLGPVPFAPAWPDLGLWLPPYVLPALLGLLVARLSRRLSRLLLSAPFGLLFANLGYAFGAKTRITLALVCAAGAVVGLFVIRPGNRRGMTAVTALSLIVAGGAACHGRATAARGGPPSVLFVVFDTTAVGHLSAYGYARPTTPNLAALAGQSLVYNRAVAGASWTTPSHGAMFTGSHLSEMGFNGWDFDRPAEGGTIAADLAATGRATAAISANPFVPQDEVLRTGFDSSWDVLRLIEPYSLRVVDHLRGRWGYRGPGMRVTTLALDWVDRLSPRRRPWFLFVNFMDPHAPYTPPRRERLAFAPNVDPNRVADDPRLYNSGRLPFTPEARAAVRDLYDGEIAAMDRAFGYLVAGLRKRGYDATNLLLIVTADHGESLGEHGFIGHLLGMSDDLLHVPLLISGPSVRAGVVDRPVQTVQLRATIRALLGLEPRSDIAPALPPWGVFPTLLISERPEPRWYWEELYEMRSDVDLDAWRGNWVAVERDGVKVIFDDRGRGATYDLRTDPGEQDPRPLGEGAPLVQAYQEWLKTALAGRPPGPSGRTQRALKSLGYSR
ncbi:MAG TPA: sulfatase-like hydrolase/transferase [Acidimicrobiales bacterium]|jgi:arylsulfatase A-like enzyme|nr:sulfatase-like hydrolase/transferase [Acidimicrobiales bacterium]